MKKVISLVLAMITVLSAFSFSGLLSFGASEITIAPYEDGFENLNGRTSLLVMPKIAGNWTDDWGTELLGYTWELSFQKADASVVSVRQKPSEIYPGNSWGIVRFAVCEAAKENRFVPEKGVSYTLSVKVYNGSSLLYTANGGEATWTLDEDPIVPDEPEPDGVIASGDGWDLQGGVLTLTKQSAAGNASAEYATYGWNGYREHIYEVIVGDGVTAIGKLAFDSCKNLQKITFGRSTVTFFNDCMARNANLKTVIFNAPAVAIGQGIVYLSNNIETVYLSDQTYEEFKTLATKSAYNFESYGGIRTGFDRAEFIDRVSYQSSITEGVLTVSGFGASVGDETSVASSYAWYNDAASVKKVVIQEGVISIGAHAFDGMPALEEIRVPASVKSAGDYAFANLPALRRITFASSCEDIGTGAFAGTPLLESVVLIEQNKSDFLNIAAASPLNHSSNGGVATGLDTASFFTIHASGAWAPYGALSEFGENCKLYDVNKDLVLTIDDITELLNYLASNAQWVNDFYNVDGKGLHTSINDVSALLDALSRGHNHVFEEMPAQSVSCTEDGYNAYYRCAVCGEPITARTLTPAPGHTVVHESAVPVTCGKDGLTAGSYCSVCHTVFEEQQVIPATGAHTLVETGRVEPTCGKDGATAGKYCVVCGFSVQGHEVIPATGAHTLVTDEAIDATCTRAGLTAGTHCTVCGKAVEPQTVVAARGHQYTANRCIYCGKADTALLSGKTALFTGDSLCAASTFDKEHQWWGWAERIKQAYGLSSYKKTGADGASVSNCRGTNTIINQINNSKNGKYDYIVLEGGTNDGWDVVSVGTMTSGTAAQAQPSAFDLSTFAGGLENLFYYTKLYFPTAKIGYVFTHKMNSNTGTLRNMSAYLAMAKSICEKWDIPMLNVDESPDFAVKYYAGLTELVPDGIHPSSAGYEMLYPAIGRFMAEITLNGGFAIYTAEVETVEEGPAPYAPLPDKEEDPQGWIKWLQKDYGQTTPLIEGGSAYGIRYNADGGTHTASPWEFWSGHFQFDYIFSPGLIDLTENIGKADYPYIWEIWYKDSDVEEDYRFIRTVPWSVYAPSGIYRIETYDQGMNDLHLDENGGANKYDIVIIIYDKNSGDMVGWKKDQIQYTDSTELFIADALAAGAIGK